MKRQLFRGERSAKMSNAIEVGNLMKEVHREMEEGVYNYTINGECSRCGGCCSRYLPLSKKEIKEIQRYIKKKHIQRQIHIGVPTAKPIPDLVCPLLKMNVDGGTECMAYPVRPHICRAFKCNQPPSQIKENKEQFWKDRRPCDMVEVFFNGE